MRPISHIAPAALMELLRMAPLSDGKVTFAWKTAVGPALERVTTVRLAAGALMVETTGPQWTLLGDQTVQSIDVRTHE